MITASLFLITLALKEQTIALETLNASADGWNTKLLHDRKIVKQFAGRQLIRWSSDGNTLYMKKGRDLVSVSFPDFKEKKICSVDDKLAKSGTVDYDPLSNRALVTLNSGDIYLYDKTWRRIITGAQMKRLSGRSLQMNGSMTSRLQPGGKSFAIGLPSETEIDSDTGQPHLDTFLVTIDGRVCRRIGRGAPVRWIDSSHVLSQAETAYVLDTNGGKEKAIASCDLADAKGAEVFILNSEPTGWVLQIWNWQKHTLVKRVRIPDRYITKFAVR